MFIQNFEKSEGGIFFNIISLLTSVYMSLLWSGIGRRGSHKALNILCLWSVSYSVHLGINMDKACQTLSLTLSS